MSSKQLEDGKRWIKSKFSEIARELGVSITNLEWKESTDDFDHLRLSLLYQGSGTQHVEKFAITEIEDVVGTPAIQA